MRSPCSRSFLAVVATFVFLTAAAAPLRAQSYDAATGGVARISVVHGSISVQHGDGGRASGAVVNAPLFAGDYVRTGANARGELQLDGVSMVRLGSSVQMRVTRLDANDRELQLAAGTIELRIFRFDALRTQIDTPSIAVRPSIAGAYRITVDPAGRTALTVRSGRAEAIGANETRSALSGSTLVAEGQASHPMFHTTASVALDDFDRFNADRDAGEARALSDAYAPASLAGIDDLEAYGGWVSDATYGDVWVPSYTAPGWAPYRDGRWTWENPYGWTWIAAEPWGWAPYHYGRWFHHRHRGWCWVPVGSLASWSPALVTFITVDTVGAGFSGVGWVPLAPFEPFFPWWGTYSMVDAPPGGTIRRHLLNAPLGLTTIARQKFLEGGGPAGVPQRSTGWSRFDGNAPLRQYAAPIAPVPQYASPPALPRQYAPPAMQMPAGVQHRTP